MTTKRDLSQGPFPKEPAERTWEAHGMTCALVRNPFGGCNGYVKLPTGYPKGWTDYDKIPLEAHGGLTYGPDEDGWIGFDTLHSGDTWVGRVDPNVRDSYRDILTADRYRNVSWAREWDEDAVVAECERIAEQAATLMESC